MSAFLLSTKEGRGRKMTIIFLQPEFQERIWGGTALQKWFPAAGLGPKIGEAWVISGHPHGSSVVESGQYEGQTLEELYHAEPQLFGYPKEPQFPLLVKILDAKSDLSIQVHPNDGQAQHVGAAFGKTECWYVLDAAPKAKMILGHKAKTQNEFIKQVNKNRWDKLVVEEPIKKGDFIYIPSGTVHALGAGTLVLEVQQSSDTTYRLYDYDRTDEAGNKRTLHIEQALDVMAFPYEKERLKQDVFTTGKNKIVTFIDNQVFTVKKLTVKERFEYKRVSHYVLVTLIDGAGTVNGEPIVKGSSFIIPSTVSDVVFDGVFEAIIAYTV
jgi:mannose-6-phosphate isomerase